ncbi:hypothetical protein [Mesorhizobium sp. CA4]|uniref:hypothetical protein n=1 Tax=Mesorhizobium sp. CA4 TaxID=588499 RepID=UPI001CD0E2D6|nr:hypothetical protein [Mesorhizobium sp. CA4]MBZ9821905.1 hypothetical protein [Mesorhizobium sp. CA4]
MVRDSQAGAKAIRTMIRSEQTRRALQKLLGLEVNPVLPQNFVSLLKALEEAEEGKDEEPHPGSAPHPPQALTEGNRNYFS